MIDVGSLIPARSAIGTGVRVLDITDKFGDVLVRLVISDSCSDNVSRFSCREVLSHE